MTRCDVRPGRLQQLLRLVRTRLRSQTRTPAGHRAFQQRRVRDRPLSGSEGPRHRHGRTTLQVSRPHSPPSHRGAFLQLHPLSGLVQSRGRVGAALRARRRDLLDRRGLSEPRPPCPARRGDRLPGNPGCGRTMDRHSHLGRHRSHQDPRQARQPLRQAQSGAERRLPTAGRRDRTKPHACRRRCPGHLGCGSSLGRAVAGSRRAHRSGHEPHAHHRTAPVLQRGGDAHRAGTARGGMPGVAGCGAAAEDPGALSIIRKDGHRVVGHVRSDLHPRDPGRGEAARRRRSRRSTLGLHEYQSLSRRSASVPPQWRRGTPARHQRHPHHSSEGPHHRQTPLEGWLPVQEGRRDAVGAHLR